LLFALCFLLCFLVMWNDRLRIAERVADDWSTLSADERSLALTALESIDEDPIAGAPLFEPLRGLWSYRAEHLRIVYRIVAEARFVVVLSIGRAAP
jgi:mRNA-degrading endonuclease RelE of RelBE toxin-antitoxin system